MEQDKLQAEEAPEINEILHEEPPAEPAPDESAQPAEQSAHGSAERFGGALFNLPPQLEKLEQIPDEEFWQQAAAAARTKRRRPSATLIILAVLMLLAAAFVLSVMINGRGWLVNLISGDRYMEFTLPIAEIPEGERNLKDESGRYTAEGLAEAVSPSVVSLEMFKEFYGVVPFSQGSGIIMTADGYVVTNAHVVDGADKIKAILSDGTEYSAKVIGADKATDIAVIKLPASGLQPAVFGDSSGLHLGEEVIAIGSPAGFYGTVTKGIISGLDRRIRVEEFATSMSCIQIDAAINPGNSGGALFNMWGQVVGITSSKLASTEYDGIGFAISMNAAKPIIEEIMEKGVSGDKARIGITFYMVTEETAKQNDLASGLFIVSIDPSCDIANTMLEPEDIITELDGQRIQSTDQVADIVKEKNPGDVMTARVYRKQDDGTFTEFDIEFALMKDEGTFVKNKEG